MHILGYGEDALTYWALTHRLFDILKEPPLNDPATDQNNIIVFYRPSFGRSGGHESSQFGEFDAIIGTLQAVYLIESKWTGEPFFDGKVMLAPWQLLRHQIFRWIRSRWQEQRPADWQEFRTRNADDFADQFQGKRLAPIGSRLASNFSYILRQLQGVSARMSDVLLFFHLEGAPVPRGVVAVPPGDHEFTVVPYAYQPLNPEDRGAIIDMQRV